MVNFRLKKLRENRHLSQTRLAMELNMSQNSISRYETLAREANYETLIQIARYFGVSVDYLLGQTDIPDRP
jgi:transcriptional regulator with XRE-family HTH domain